MSNKQLFEWDKTEETIQNLLFGKNTDNLLENLDRLHCLMQNCVLNEDTLCLIDIDLFNEIQKVVNCDNVSFHFGKSLRDMKGVIRDQAFRKHEIFITYKGPGKLRATSDQLPYTNLQEREYCSLEDIIITFNNYVNDLAYYFQQLELIDEYCTIVEPARPSFKDDYRKILLEERVWLHVEVTPEGLATNIQLVGQSEKWQNKLQEGLLAWDHDKNIVTNIMSVFDIHEFPKDMKNKAVSVEEELETDSPICSICLCTELPDVPGVPQPLCQNNKCGVYYHRNCLYQWLLACAGNRPPAFGVATGSCPSCLKPIACNERDNY